MSNKKTKTEGGRQSAVNAVVIPLYGFERAFITYNFTASKDDNEKLITPGIVYFSDIDKETKIKVYGIAIGWWHWSLNLHLVPIPKKEKEAV